ncbi:MAG TPA: hypothetical protein VLG67_03870 [Candidatus Saccharimonadales bacterium]|nr:hypothetical protein [Candidatus Saccharimonadales bacterium]
MADPERRMISDRGSKKDRKDLDVSYKDETGIHETSAFRARQRAVERKGDEPKKPAK